MKRILRNRVPFIWILLKLDMYYKTVWLCQCDTVFTVFSGYQVSCILILPVFYMQPIGGAWRPPLQYTPLTPPVQPALHWLHLYDTPSPCHSLLQAPPTAAEQPGYSRHELFKLASCALIERQGSVGQKAGGWHSRCVEYFFSLQPFSFLKRKELLGLGWPCCDSVSAYILKSAAQCWRRCSEVQAHQRWMDTTWGQRRPTTLSLRVSTSSLVRPSIAAHQTSKGVSLFLVMFVYPSNHTSLFGISSTVPKHMAEPGLYIHISVFRLLGILLGLN